MKDGNFKFGDKCEDEIISMSREWDKDKPMTSQTPGWRSMPCYPLSRGELMESHCHILGLYLTREGEILYKLTALTFLLNCSFALIVLQDDTFKRSYNLLCL